MQNIQEVFNRLQTKKLELKDLKRVYKDSLDHAQDYKDVSEELRTLRQQKKDIEERIKADFTSEFTKMNDLKIDIDSDQELLQDIALTRIMKGEEVVIIDEYDSKYEPVFSVKFKRS